MIFHETRLRGAYTIDIEEHADERGFFARTWCRREFAEHDLVAEFAQCSLSYNREAGTLRGLHYQRDPYGEAKVVQCVRGAVFDVILDLRTESPTFGRWHAVELTARSRRMLYVPERFAHGFQALEPDTEVSYTISTFYAPEASCGIRYDDPSLAIPWPLPVTQISARDRAWPALDKVRDFHVMPSAV